MLGRCRYGCNDVELDTWASGHSTISAAMIEGGLQATNMEALNRFASAYKVHLSGKSVLCGCRQSRGSAAFQSVQGLHVHTHIQGGGPSGGALKHTSLTARNPASHHCIMSGCQCLNMCLEVRSSRNGLNCVTPTCHVQHLLSAQLVYMLMSVNQEHTG